MSLQALIDKTRDKALIEMAEGKKLYSPSEILKLCEAAEVMFNAHKNIVWQHKAWAKMQRESEQALENAHAIARGDNG